MGAENGRLAGPRCIALVGPFASGKTALLEAILARTGAIPRQGRIAEGSTKGDSSPEARAHGMSVEANIAETEFMGDVYTFVDCPGSVEFQHEADAPLAAADLAVVVAEADEKKIPALQLILRDLEARGIPHMLFLNKVDKLTGRVRDMLELLQPASALPLVLRQIPMRKSGTVTGFIDLALERAFEYSEGAPSHVTSIPAEETDREHEARTQMLEQIADFDDALLEQLIEDVTPANDHVFADLAREVREGLICPVLIGSAEHGNGILRLMKALRHEAPSVAETRKRLNLTDSKSPCLQVLKTIHTPHGGKLSVVRVLAGLVTEANPLVSGRGTECKVSGLYRLMCADTFKRDTAREGETLALGKLEGVRTGDTLYTATNGTDKPGNLLPFSQPEPVYALSIAPEERKDDVRLSSALAKLLEEDPSLRLRQVQETGETVLEGQGEMHLRVTIERLTNKFGISVITGRPAIPYRETIRKPVTKRGRHKKQSGGHGQFGDVVLDIRPLPRGEGISFAETVTGGAVPKQYFSAVETGVREYLESAGPFGFPVVDVSVTLTDGSYHSVDSSDQSFKAAAQIAMREGMPEASPVLLEPVLEITVYCPSDATANINAILPSRRGQILGLSPREGWAGWDEVKALIPQAEIEDLIIELRSATAGVGSFATRFDHYAELSGRLADEVMNKFGTKAA